MDYLNVDVLNLKLNGQANFETIEDAKIRILNSSILEVLSDLGNKNKSWIKDITLRNNWIRIKKRWYETNIQN